MSLSLIPMAYADTATGAAPHAADGFSTIILLVGFIAIFYFLIWRPQSKRMKEQKQLISSLSKGDEIITSGGILGKITKVSEDFLQVVVAEGVEVTVQKSAVSTSLPKGTLKLTEK